MRWFRKQPTIARAMVGFVMIATVLCLLFGPIGMLYALGFEVLYLVTIGFAALLDPDRTAIGFKVGRRFQLGQRYARIVPTGDIKRFDSAKRPLSTKPSLDRPRPREARRCDGAPCPLCNPVDVFDFPLHQSFAIIRSHRGQSYGAPLITCLMASRNSSRSASISPFSQRLVPIAKASLLASLSP
jgi:hypothetical protein